MISKTNIAILLYILVFLIGCSNSINKKSTSSQSTITELISYLGKKLEFKDYPCKEAIKQAQKDLINGDLIYFDLEHFDFNRSNKEMAILLKPYEIELFESYTYNMDSEESNCYENYMNKSITKKYGNHFIDSLRSIAEVDYVKNNPDRIYKFEECDTTSRYSRAISFEDFFDIYKNDFFKDFYYPNTYYFNSEKYYSYTSAKFILMKDGTIQITEIETTFQNPKNKIHRKLFDKRVKDFIKDSKWIPAKSAGIVVNSKIQLTFHYE